MEIIRVNQDNIEKEHICCSISDKKSTQVKKEWMKQRFAEGYRFWKMDGCGKAFIEATPAENAWVPIDAEGWMFLDCFWVAGSFAKNGYGSSLLEVCVAEAKAEGKKGVAAISSVKKKPFLSDGKFYKAHGFLVADTAYPDFELLALPFSSEASMPAFCSCAREGKTDGNGIVIFYTDHCPWNAKYIPRLTQIALERNAPVSFRKIISKEEAQASPSPFPTYSVFADGKFLSNEMMSDKKFVRFLEEKGY
ncbi:MAG: YoaP domain-containing protein [Christensenella sp.]|nr:YoaP domain-containing protein [Christensenella sp.]